MWAGRDSNPQSHARFPGDARSYATISPHFHEFIILRCKVSTQKCALSAQQEKNQSFSIILPQSHTFPCSHSSTACCTVALLIMNLRLFYGKVYITKSEELAGPSHSSFRRQRYAFSAYPPNFWQKNIILDTKSRTALPP